MRVDERSLTGGGSADAATGGVATPVPGRVDVRERAYRTVAETVSAQVIGIPRRDVRVEVAESSRGFSVRVSSPLPVPDLDDTEAIVGGVPVLERARQIQEQLQSRLAELFGRDVSRITLTITGAVAPERRRVR